MISANLSISVEVAASAALALAISGISQATQNGANQADALGAAAGAIGAAASIGALAADLHTVASNLENAIAREISVGSIAGTHLGLAAGLVGLVAAGESLGLTLNNPDSGFWDYADSVLGVVSAFSGLLAGVPLLSPAGQAVAAAVSVATGALQVIIHNREAVGAAFRNIWNDLSNAAGEFGEGSGLFGGIYAVQTVVENLFNAAQRFFTDRRDPLTLDLDGDGIETVAPNATNPILFDHDGDGVKSGTGWVKADDGFLVWDKSGNGLIDSGRELFGDSFIKPNAANAIDGFDALASLDSNGDGLVDAADANFASLRVWQDANQDGISQSAELKTLASLGIASFNVAKTANSQTLANGNQIADLGTFNRADGSKGALGDVSTLADVNLVTDTFYREFSDSIPLAPGVEALPDTQGSGAVRDLREAASQSGTLQTLLAQYNAAPTRAAQMALLDQMLKAWAATSGMQDSLEDRAAEIPATVGLSGYKIRYMGFGAVSRSAHVGVAPADGSGTPNPDPYFVGATLPDDAHNVWLDGTYKGLIDSWAQKIHILEAFNGRYFFKLPTDDAGAAPKLSAVEGLSQAPNTPTYAAGGFRTLLISYTQQQLDLLQQSYDSLRQSIYDNLLLQTRFKPLMDKISLNIGDAGISFDFSAVEADLRARVAADPVTGLADLADFEAVTSDMLLGTGWSGESILQWALDTYPVTDTQVPRFAVESRFQVVGYNAFAGTGSANADRVMAGLGGSAISAGAGDDTVVGASGNDTLEGGEGNDLIDGGNGNDVITDYGSSFLNILKGGAGNDTISGSGTFVGGKGNDVMTALRWNSADTYMFNLGDGQDVVIEWDNNNWYGNSGALDVLKFGPGIVASGVGLVRSGNDMIFKVSAIDQVTIRDWFVTSARYIEEIHFADGTVWDLDRMKGMVLPLYSATAEADNIPGWEGIDNIAGLGGNDIINGYGGNDTLDGGDGNDTLDGGAGNDSLLGGAGNDSLLGGTGDDTLEGGDGDDYLNDTSGANVLNGGAGNDTLYGRGIFTGGAGNDTLTVSEIYSSDTYVFNLGDGQDTIVEDDWGYYGSTGAVDVLRFGAGITPANVSLGRNVNDMIFKVGATDQVTVKDWFVHSRRYVEEIRFEDGTVWNLATIQSTAPALFNGTAGGDAIAGWDGIDYIAGLGGNDIINGYGGNDTLDGGDGNDTLDGGAGNDSLLGGAGNDSLLGGTGDDTLEGGDGDDYLNDTSGANVLNGGAGNDTLYGRGIFTGGAGNDTLTVSEIYSSDTYVFNLGDGQDTIVEDDWGYYGSTGAVDVIKFGPGINPSFVSLGRSGDDMIFKVSATDQVMVKDWFVHSRRYIEQVRFDDGTMWNQAAMQSMVPALYNARATAETLQGWDGIDNIAGLGGDDIINGYGGNDTLDGGDGNDTLDGGAGNDSLVGGAGADSLLGGTGDDTLEGGDGDDYLNDTSGANVLNGGAGNDTLYGRGIFTGGAGNDTLTVSEIYSSDTYVFNLGDGQDTIVEDDWGYYGSTGAVDVLRFGAGITPANVSLGRNVNDMIFKVGATDQVTVKDWFVHSRRYVEEIRFEDGTVWNLATIQSTAPALFNGTAGGDAIAGWDGIDYIAGLGGNDIINGYGGNDTLDGGDGNDTLDGGAGNDSLLGGAGNDSLLGGTGDDTLEGGDGDDYLNDTSGANVLNGGAGNDTLYGRGIFTGGAGNDTLTVSEIYSSDTYVFNLGDGQDTIVEDDWGYYGSTGAVDVLRFGAGITPASVSLGRNVDDMIFKISATDQVTVKDWFVHSRRYVEEIRFEDGTVWNLATIQSMAPALYSGTELADTIIGSNGIDYVAALGGDDSISGFGGNDTLDGGAGNDTLDGGTGNDWVLGGADNDSLQGGEGDDTLEGGDGDDVVTDSGSAFLNVLKGGAGNDTITGTGTFEGGAGNDVMRALNIFSADTYVFNLGDGQDTIVEWDRAYWGSTGAVDVLKFGAGIDPSLVSLGRSGDDMIFKVTATDQVTLKGWFASSAAYIEQVQFADASSTLWSLATIQSMAPTLFNGTAGADTIAGWDGIDYIAGLGSDDSISGFGGNDTLDGGAGNDTLDGGTGNDWVLGGADNDSLQGGEGDDTLEGGDGDDVVTDSGSAFLNVLKGGAGNDTITGTGTFEGGAGNDVMRALNIFSADTYVFNLGDGQDTIVEWDRAYWGSTGAVDVLKFGAGIDPSSVSLGRSGDDMIFKVTATDQVTLKGWFASSAAYIEQVQFADASSTLWSLATIQSMAPTLFNGTAGADTIAGWDGIDYIAGLGSDDSISGFGGNDTLDGGAGNDTLDGGTGNDWVLGGADNDSLQGGEGDDTLEGGDGDDVVTDSGSAFLNVLKGGAGNDTITGTGTFEGGAGNDVMRALNIFSADTYVFNLGDGQDTIVEWDRAYWGSTGAVDVLKFGAGIDPSLVSLGRSGDDMIFKVTATDQVTLKGWFASSAAYIEQVQFADASSTLWTASMIQALASNAPPTAVADTKAATENVTVTTTAATGVLANDTDVDSGDSKTVSAVSFGATAGTVGTALAGIYGALTLAADGSYTYFANNSAAEKLGIGQTATEVFNYAVKDSVGATSSTTLTFTITGANDGPVAVADNQTATEDLTVTTNATTGLLANDTDADAGDTKTVSAVGFSATAGTVGAALVGTYGTLTLAADGAYTYLADNSAAQALKAGATATEAFNYTVKDAAGASSSTTLTFTITGANDGPVAFADTKAATEDVAVTTTAATGVLANDIDVDGGDSKTVSAISSGATAGTVGSALAGSYGTLTLAADGAYTYLANKSAAEALAANQTATEVFNYTVKDGAGATSSSTLTFTLTGTNDAPIVATPLTNQTGKEGVAFNYAPLAGSFTDVDAGDVLTYSAKLTSGSALPAWLSVNVTTGALSGTPPSGSAGAVAITLTATDKVGASAASSFSIAIASALSIINGTSSAEKLTGTSADDQINGLAGNDTLIGAAGNDTLDGGAGNDSMSGGLGNDTYLVDSTSDIVVENASEGTDLVQSSVTYMLAANVENLTLTGTAAINGMGNTLANVITGNSAANTLDGGSGADSLIGGAGNDTYIVDNTGDVVTENANEGTDLVKAGVTYTLAANIENVTLTGTGAINGTGNTLDNLLTGNSAINTLTGGAGNDTLDGGAGADSLIGGAGNDTYIVDNTGDVVTESANEGTDLVQASVTYTLGNNVENLTLTGSSALNGTGNALDNVLTGNSGVNKLTGAAGNDTLDGGAGADSLIGGLGNDTYIVDNTGDVITENASEGTDLVKSSVTWTLGNNFENLTLTGTAAINGTGNTLNNVLTGNSAANTLTGLAGNDTLDGGAGNDSLVGGTGNDTYLLGRGYGTDTITESDATSGNTDVLKAASDVAASQLWFRKSGNNLEVSIIGTSDKDIIANWYLGNQYHVEQFKSGDGKTLLDSQVANLVSAMAAFAPPGAGQTTLPANYQSSLNTVIAANWK